jgi:preprotein translocase subunit SecE
MKAKNYIKESYTELVHKVSWPSWADLQTSAIVVMVATLVIALLVFSMDYIFSNLMSFIYSI